MRNLLVHGCYDQHTLRTLQEIGVKNFGFDLRGRSPNLVPFHDLKTILQNLLHENIHLIFENDKASTIRSFLDMLNFLPSKIQLEFRDKLEAAFYDSFNTDFLWLFSLEADWKNILQSRYIKGVILPLGYEAFYQTNTTLWQLLEAKQLDVYLQPENLLEAKRLQQDAEVSLSLDLGRDYEVAFRTIDQFKLRKDFSVLL